MSDTKRKKAAKKRQAKTPDTEVKRDLCLWLSLAVCVLLFLSNLGVGGPVGGAIGRFFFGLFGVINYVLPIGLLIGIFFAVSNKGNVVATVKLVAAFLFVVFLDGIIAVILFGKDQPTPSDAYLQSYQDKSGGGLLGTLIATPFAKGFGSVLTVILFLIFMIVCLVLVTEKGFLSRFIDKKRVDLENHEKESRPPRQKKIREPEKEKEPLKRASHKVSGINVTPFRSASKAKKTENKKEGLREVTKDDLEEIKKNAPEKPEEEMPEPEVKEAVDLYSGEEVKTQIHMGAFTEKVEEKAKEAEPVISELQESELTSDEPETWTEPESEPDPETQQMTEIVPDEPVYEVDETEEPLPDEASEEPLPEDVAEEPDVEVIEAEPEEQEPPALDENTAPAQTQASAPAPEHHVSKPYQFPPVSLLTQMKQNGGADSEEYLQQTAEKLEVTLKNFGVDVTVTDVTCGPAVTRYELHPKLGVKVSKIVNLADDIKLNLAARDIRIEAPIPGKSAVGIEVPNKNILTVPFREMVESREFKEAKSKIAFAAGRDIAGKVIISDIAKMPHLLIAGATGSGKSVCINTIIMSILYRAEPSEVKFIMIDPKVVELSVYNGIPHLLIPVVTDPKKAAGALNWAVHEMDDRYKKFAETGSRDIKGYNAKIKNGRIKNRDGVEVNVKKMPQIVVIVDELADLMMQSPKEVEESICRLAQLARACGIHLVIATQRPSVNVITGLIKANMPSRIAFAVTSGVDSRTILDMNGAEKLLGKGDMLYFPQGLVKPIRVQGAFVPDEDVSSVVGFLRKENETEEDDTAEINDFIENASSEATQISENAEPDDGRDQYFADAGRLVIEKQKGSIGMLQRNFKIGFNRAARIMDQLEEAGVVGSEIGTKPRTVRMDMAAFESMLQGGNE
ncbi:MAG: DNA translocase FtsK [Lachnospiraceae bacterium]|nr:DNA translocase FtsK [Lachnospiraceae bacterium]